MYICTRVIECSPRLQWVVGAEGSRRDGRLGGEENKLHGSAGRAKE